MVTNSQLFIPAFSTQLKTRTYEPSITISAWSLTARDGYIIDLYTDMNKEGSNTPYSINATMEVTNVQPIINFSTAWENAIASCTTAAICQNQSLNTHGQTPLLYSWAKRLLHLTRFFLVPAAGHQPSSPATYRVSAQLVQPSHVKQTRASETKGPRPFLQEDLS